MVKQIVKSIVRCIVRRILGELKSKFWSKSASIFLLLTRRSDRVQWLVTFDFDQNWATSSTGLSSIIEPRDLHDRGDIVQDCKRYLIVSIAYTKFDFRQVPQNKE